MPVLNMIVEKSKINPRSIWENDIIVPLPLNLPGSIRFAQNLSRSYDLNITLEIPVLNISVKSPIIILEWSPHMQDIFPEIVYNQLHGQDINQKEKIQNVVEKNPFKESDSTDQTDEDVQFNEENLLI